MINLETLLKSANLKSANILPLNIVVDNDTVIAYDDAEVVYRYEGALSHLIIEILLALGLDAECA